MQYLEFAHDQWITDHAKLNEWVFQINLLNMVSVNELLDEIGLTSENIVQTINK